MSGDIEFRECADEELTRLVGPVKRQIRVFMESSRGLHGHAMIMYGATDNQKRFYLLGKPRWLSTKDIAVADEYLSLPIPQAQELLDGLWKLGLRPTEEPEPTAERHERALAFIDKVIERHGYTEGDWNTARAILVGELEEGELWCERKDP